MSNTGSDTETASLGAGQRRKGVIDTRRAEQNRAAQRAFRQRKERYVKELENKVRDMQGLQERVQKLEDENAQLRQRVWELSHRPSTSASWSPSDEESVTPASASLPGTPSLPSANPTRSRRYHPYSPPPPPPPPTLQPPTSAPTTGPSAPSPPPPLSRSAEPLHPADQPSQPALRQQQHHQASYSYRAKEHVGMHPYQRHHQPARSDGGGGADKGRVLDDLITILRSRHRPPIPSHLGGDSSSPPSDSPPAVASPASIEPQQQHHVEASIR